MYDKNIIERFMKIATASVADACDSIVKRKCFMDYEVKPRITDKRIVGPAITVKEVATNEVCPPQHALEAIEGATGGEIIVIALEGSDKDVAVWGGLMTAGAVTKKLAGAVLDAGVRDVTEIKRDFGFQIFSRSISPGTTVTRYKTFANNVPVVCGGIETNPGDLIVADPDGVVVVPKDKVEEVLLYAEDIEIKEAAQTKYIKETGSLIQGLAKYNRI
ncbi:MAG: RraA family protein [Eubacteriales bacterium]|nr:RraA family protein [Eubacteriales bacterium]